VPQNTSNQPRILTATTTAHESLASASINLAMLGDNSNSTFVNNSEATLTNSTSNNNTITHSNTKSALTNSPATATANAVTSNNLNVIVKDANGTISSDRTDMHNNEFVMNIYNEMNLRNVYYAFFFRNFWLKCERVKKLENRLFLFFLMQKAII
jgi:hypothetical protein